MGSFVMVGHLGRAGNELFNLVLHVPEQGFLPVAVLSLNRQQAQGVLIVARPSLLLGSVLVQI